MGLVRLKIVKSVFFWSNVLRLERRFWHTRDRQFGDLYYAISFSFVENFAPFCSCSKAFAPFSII